MPRRMNFDPNKVTAGRLVLDENDSVEFTITDAKLFSRTREEADGSTTDVYGINYILEVNTGNQAGKTLVHSLYMHTDKVESMNKQFIMAALGFTTKQEIDFNETYPAGDGWNIEWPESDEEDELIGDVWKAPVGKKIVAAVTTAPQRNNPNEMQNNFRWRPF